MFFGSHAGERLEPVRKVRSAIFYSPVFHGLRDGICHGQVQLLSFVNGLPERIIDIGGKPCSHHPVVKDHAAEIILYIFHDAILLFAKKEAKTPFAYQHKRRLCLYGADYTPV